MLEDFLWVEKYRPKTVSDTILTDELKKTFQQFVDQKNIPNLILSGTAGVGKTTVAKAMCEELGCDYIVINGSMNGNIDMLRNDISQFASSVSLMGGRKMVILDEADYLNAQSTQPALRGFIEEFSNNCRFILTCNFKNRIIEPLHSRCAVIEFNTTKKQLASLAGDFMKRLQFILKNEGVEYKESVIADLIIQYAPDWRRVVNECQRHSSGGQINPVALLGMSDQNIAQVVSYLKAKDFKSMRSWVANNTALDGTVMFRKIYDSLYDIANPGSIPGAVLILADYSYKSAFVADKELNLVACLTELMGNVEWK